jgi:hypothetical protein
MTLAPWNIVGMTLAPWNIVGMTLAPWNIVGMTLAPWNIVLPVQLTVPQLIKKFPTFYKPEVHYRIHKCMTPAPVLKDTR